MKHFNIYEEAEPTEKDLESIKKEKPAKIPKKKYFGGATKPEDVDTKAAIASHKAGIKAAGKAAVKKNQDERDKAEQQAEAYRALGLRIDEFAAALVRGAGALAKNPAVRKAVGGGLKKAGGAMKKGAKIAGREAATVAGQELGARAGQIGAKKEEPELAHREYNNAYVNSLMESEKEKPTSHPSSTQSRMKKELGSEAYEKLSSRPNDPSPVEAAKARRQKQNAWTEYAKIGRLFMEWKPGPTAKGIDKRSPGGEGSRMSDQGDKPVSKDPLVAAETKKTVANVDKKLGTKTNMKTADVVQGSMNRRRAESKARAAAGSKDEGIPSVDRGSKFGKALSKAEGEEDRKKMAGPSG